MASFTKTKNPAKHSGGTDITNPGDVVGTVLGYALFTVLAVAGLAAGLWAWRQGTNAAGVGNTIPGWEGV